MNIPNEVSAQCVWAGAVLPHTKTQEKKMLEATFSGKSRIQPTSYFRDSICVEWGGALPWIDHNERSCIDFLSSNSILTQLWLDLSFF